MALKAEVRQPATDPEESYFKAEDYYLRAVEHNWPIIGEKRQQEYYLNRLKNRLKIFRLTFIEPARDPKRTVVWPRERGFRDLDECIFSLARSLRKKKPLTYSDAVELVDKKWPHLHLWNSINTLSMRALELDPKFPVKSEGVRHFEWILGLAKENGRRADLARRFLKDHFLLLARKIKLSKVSWGDYEEILLKKDGKMIFLQCDMHFPSVKTNCYVRYLEMQRDWGLWEEDWERCEAAQGKREPFFEWVERMDTHDAKLGETRRKEKRRLATERQRRYREKIRAEMRDRLFREIRDDEQVRANLRHAVILSGPHRLK
jgi:hypothetical protein